MVGDSFHLGGMVIIVRPSRWSTIGPSLAGVMSIGMFAPVFRWTPQPIQRPQWSHRSQLANSAVAEGGSRWSIWRDIDTNDSTSSPSLSG